ncbi:BA14K family protein [Ensifer adhaerens]|uniref:BA14K family protein n=1 Tax=Ensifer adhaerens TaxID=106592 RepID=UPI001CC19A80|nr:BA14K family protein [Ensifer adhaerens]MBZ7924512.1 BA14K family protein [Ensifer adhaerens]UAX96248.1 BA14K family protein [Ensifer adhaerens]UAY04409.1 BA14K family protein [Ensifer adhaerens]UAY09841.1 BA14K family protein [Ensifer adhaerens]
MNRLTIIALSMVPALTSVSPAMAFPIAADAPTIEATQAQLVQYRRYGGGYHGGYHGGYYGGGYYHGHHHGGGDAWAWALGGLAAGAIIGGALAQPYYGSGYYDQGYYDQGYYGPSYYRPRYYAPRYYAPRYYRQTYYSGGNAHTSWCYARYRSYRAYDDTFQPYYGPRQVCVSPY